MLLTVPGYIEESGVMKEPIRHEWNDDKPRQACRGDDTKFMQTVGRISRRGKLAVCTGIAEWIVWRLSGHSSDPILFQVIEAIWASVIDLRYIHPLDTPGKTLEWEDWRGPIRGPLCATFHVLLRALDCASRNEATEVDAVSLSNLALYVMVNQKPFKAWRRFVAERLIELHPRTANDPTGVPVPREGLDPAFPYNPEMAPELLSKFLSQLDYRNNPYLRSPADMRRAGFEGTPYQL